MTAIHQQLVRSRETAGGDRLDSLQLAWDVLADSPGVIRLVGAGRARARLVLVFDARSVRVHLETLASAHGVPERTPIGDALPATIQPATMQPGGEGLVHVEVPGVLRATMVLVEGAPPRVLYARTTLLESLGFPGGSYDRPEAEW